MIPKRYESAKYEDVSPVVKEAFKAMLAGGKSIYLHGAVGTGKTHTCWAIKKQYDLPAAYRFLRIWNVVDMMHEIKADFDRSLYDKRHLEEELTDPKDHHVLILDDLGAEKATDFVAETLYRIVNFRYNHMLPTIITSNCTVQELADKIGERSASRIVEMCDIIMLTGGDRRMQKK
jgi:DNA replication protein DnaC